MRCFGRLISLCELQALHFMPCPARSTLQLCWKEVRRMKEDLLSLPSALTCSQAGDLFRLDGDLAGATVIEVHWGRFARQTDAIL